MSLNKMEKLKLHKDHTIDRVDLSRFGPNVLGINWPGRLKETQKFANITQDFGPFCLLAKMLHSRQTNFSKKANKVLEFYHQVKQ